VQRARRRIRRLVALLAARSGLIYGTAPFGGSQVLESILQKTRGIVLIGLVIMLGLVFAVQFGGPQEWRTAAPVALAEVHGERIAPGELQASYLLAGGDNYRPEDAERYQLEPMLVMGLVERNLLAHEARSIGITVDEDELLRRVATEGTLYLSISVDATHLPRSGPIRVNFEDSNGNFNKDNLKNFIQYRLRQSIRDFTQSQVQETLAQRMREAVMSTVSVSTEEAWQAWVREQESVTLKFVRFSVAHYAETLNPTEAELAAWIEENAAAVDEEYEAQKARYTGLEKQVRARHILVKLASDAPDDERETAMDKATALLERARNGEDFATLATEHSEDVGSARKGGDLGFNPRGRMVAAFDDVQFALKPGEISDIVSSEFGLHIIKVEAIREGDVPLEEARREIGEKLYREQTAAEQAKQAATATLARLREGLSIDDLEAELKEAAAPKEGQVHGDALAPQVRETRPFGRTDTPIPGPFDASALVKQAYELTEDAPLPEAPMQLGDDWFVVRLSARSLAERDEFDDAERRRVHDALLSRRRQETLTEYVRGLRRRAEKNGKLSINATALSQATLGDEES
jgi:peptidyl-prolyl cis-trans isomerase D